MNFLKHLKNDELISEAFACYIGGKYVETGSVTSETHRGKGYATMIRAILINESLSRNLQPATSCNADNIGSAKASKKLGFKEKKVLLSGLLGESYCKIETRSSVFL